MKCSSCSAEIADKAIVCYRCGTPTAAPPVPVRPQAARGGRGRLILLVGLLVVLVGLLLFTYLSRGL